MIEDVERVGRGRVNSRNAAAAPVGDVDPQTSGASRPEQDDVEVLRVTVCELDEAHFGACSPKDQVVTTAVGTDTILLRWQPI